MNQTLKFPMDPPAGPPPTLRGQPPSEPNNERLSFYLACLGTAQVFIQKARPQDNIFMHIRNFLDRYFSNLTKYEWKTHLRIIVAGISGIQSVVIDWKRELPPTTLADVGVQFGSLVYVSCIMPASFADPPMNINGKFVSPTVRFLEKQNPLILCFRHLEVDTRDSKNLIHCDFRGCAFTHHEWGGMMMHHKTTHGTCGLYFCPHPGCLSVFSATGAYQDHCVRAHEGVRLARTVPTQEHLRAVWRKNHFRSRPWRSTAAWNNDGLKFSTVRSEKVAEEALNLPHK